MRVDRHDATVSLIADHFWKNENWEVEIEPKDNRNFKPDIVIKSKDKTRAWIIDPTIRTEISNEDIEMKNREKQVKYEPTAVQLRAEGYAVLAVKGLWIGARGIMSNEGKVLLRSLSRIFKRLSVLY